MNSLGLLYHFIAFELATYTSNGKKTRDAAAIRGLTFDRQAPEQA